MIKLLNAILLIGIFIWNPYPLQYLELKGYDTLIMSTEPVQNENIQLITILIANFSSCFAIDSYGQSIVPLKDRS